MTRKIAILACLILALARLTSRADSANQENVPASYQGFPFASGYCDAARPDCLLSIPREWTPVEIALVKKAIDEIVASEKGRDILARAQQRGFGTLWRYSLGINNSVPVPAIAAGLRRGGNVRGIHVHDRVIAQGENRDSYSHFLLVAQVLLHECMHAVDDVSDQAEFAALVGFADAGTRRTFAARTPEDVSALVRFDKELPDLERMGDWAGQWQLNRTLALAMRPIRIPSMQSIRSPAEAFAEIGSHLILDHKARTYLPRRVVEYFSANVFLRLSR